MSKNNDSMTRVTHCGLIKFSSGNPKMRLIIFRLCNNVKLGQCASGGVESDKNITETINPHETYFFQSQDRSDNSVRVG